MDPAISTRNLTRRFPSALALDDLTLEMPRGVVFGLLGPNGAGKTTMIRVLTGLISPTSGEARVLGFDPVTEPARVRESVGALLEHPGLYERLTVEDNLRLYARIWKMGAAETTRRIDEVLEAMELSDRRRDMLGDWSRGMKQKVAVARAMLHRPELLFLDEPTSGLDPVGASALRETLSGLAREGLTVFLTTHNLAEAERICARIAVISNGRLLACGSPTELREAAGTEAVEVTGEGFTDTLCDRLEAVGYRIAVREVSRLVVHPPAEALATSAPLVRLLVEEGAAIEEVRKLKPSLEEAFLQMVRNGDTDTADGQTVRADATGTEGRV